jgi:hypothetical protein
MSSNSSSPQEPASEDKPFLSEDSADVPLVSVTAELPMGLETNDARPEGGGGGNPSPPPSPEAEGPGAESVNSAYELAPAGQAALEAAVGDAETPVPLGVPTEYAAEGGTMPSPFDSTSQELDAVSIEAEVEEIEAEVDAPPEVMTSAVLPPTTEARGDSTTGAQVELAMAEEDSEPASDLDASDLVIEGEGEAEPAALASQLGPGDEDFLRRVVLPPLPQDARANFAIARAGLAGETDDHTVISGPPSPELLASMAVAPRAPAAAPLASPQASPSPGARPKRVRLTIPQFGVLMVGALVLGAFLPGQLRAILPPPLTSLLGAHGAGGGPVRSAPPIAPERAAATAVVVAPTPTPPPPAEAPAAPAVAKSATPAAAEPPTSATKPTAATPPAAARPEATARPATKVAKAGPTKRLRRAKKAPKKAFVDPFE